MNTDHGRLRSAYEATDYRVDAGPHGPFTIRVGLLSAEADALLEAAGCDAWAFITACNPRSVPLAGAENAARMTRLEEFVRGRGLVHYAGAGVATDASWPPEPSLLVLGIDEDDAVTLARGFDQHAIVVGRRGGPARLVWVCEADADGTGA